MNAPSKIRLSRLALLALPLLLALPASAQQPDTAQLRRDVESSLLSLADRDALGGSDAPLTISAPAQVRYELGAVIVPRADGAPAVMAISPGGAADRMQLQVGDRLLSINGKALSGVDDPVAVLQSTAARDEGRLRLDLRRADRQLVAAGNADIVAIPAFQLVVGAAIGGGCGYVTDNDGPEPRSEQVHDARITRIDGRSTPLQPVNRHRVDAGRHVLTVSERIPRTWLSSAQAREIARMQQRKWARAYKPLVVDVKPGMKYKVGARLLRDRLDAAGIRDNAYWEPVVWAEESERCN